MGILEYIKNKKSIIYLYLINSSTNSLNAPSPPLREVMKSGMNLSLIGLLIGIADMPTLLSTSKSLISSPISATSSNDTFLASQIRFSLGSFSFSPIYTSLIKSFYALLITISEFSDVIIIVGIPIFLSNSTAMPS